MKSAAPPFRLELRLMSKTYQIRNIPAFSGLVAVGDVDEDLELVEVFELVNTNVIVGDRNLKFPIPNKTLFIALKNLVEIEDVSTREFANDNPYGTYLYEGSFQKENLQVVHAVYQYAVTVSIIEKSSPKEKGLDKTLFVGNFFDTKHRALEIIEDMLHGAMDPDDLVFELKQLQGE